MKVEQKGYRWEAVGRREEPHVLTKTKVVLSQLMFPNTHGILLRHADGKGFAEGLVRFQGLKVNHGLSQVVREMLLDEV